MGYWGDGHTDDGWGLAMVLGMLGLGLLIAVAVGLADHVDARSGSAPHGRRLSHQPVRRFVRTPRTRSRSWPRAWHEARSTRRSTALGSTPSGQPAHGNRGRPWTIRLS